MFPNIQIQMIDKLRIPNGTGKIVRKFGRSKITSLLTAVVFLRV